MEASYNSPCRFNINWTPEQLRITFLKVTSIVLEKLCIGKKIVFKYFSLQFFQQIVQQPDNNFKNNDDLPNKALDFFLDTLGVDIRPSRPASPSGNSNISFYICNCSLS